MWSNKFNKSSIIREYREKKKEKKLQWNIATVYIYCNIYIDSTTMKMIKNRSISISNINLFYFNKHAVLIIIFISVEWNSLKMIAI